MDRPIPYRDEIKSGTLVMGLEKANYKNGLLTTGVVQDILTNKNYHPRGIKVRLTNGVILRVQKILPPEDKESAENPPVAPENHSTAYAENQNQEDTFVNTSAAPEENPQQYELPSVGSQADYTENNMISGNVPETTLLDNSYQTGSAVPDYDLPLNTSGTNAQVSEEDIQANIITPDESEGEVHTTNAYIPSSFPDTNSNE